MLTRLLFLSLLGILAVVLQIGLVPIFFQPLSSFNIILIVLIFFLFLNYGKGDLFFLIIWMGFLIDLFSPSLFGLHLLALFLTFFVALALSRIFLTNKTILVLLTLSFLVFIFYNLIFVFLNFVVSLKYEWGLVYSFKDYMRAGIIGALINWPLILFCNFLLKKSEVFFKQIFIFR